MDNTLFNRKQYFSFQNENSLYADVVCCVPRGSILGLLLFMLYVNDICNISCSFGFFLFSDNTTIISAHYDIDTVYIQANIELKKLYDWFCLNKLHLDMNKMTLIIQ